MNIYIVVNRDEIIADDGGDQPDEDEIIAALNTLARRQFDGVPRPTRMDFAAVRAVTGWEEVHFAHDEDGGCFAYDVIPYAWPRSFWGGRFLAYPALNADPFDDDSWMRVYHEDGTTTRAGDVDDPEPAPDKREPPAISDERWREIDELAGFHVDRLAWNKIGECFASGLAWVTVAATARVPHMDVAPFNDDRWRDQWHSWTVHRDGA